jgi:NAD(P)H-dependent FMN reductase
VECLRLVMGELQIADVRAQVMFSLFTDFRNFSEFTPDPRHEQELDALLKQLLAWGEALKGMRTHAAHKAA